MSRLLSNTAQNITPYVPGEQPQDKQYIKLNTNENPYPPAPGIAQLLQQRSHDSLRLYPDPDSRKLRTAMADTYGLTPDQVFAGGGSDEVLAYAFMAFFDRGDTVYFPNITYGFYKVYAELFGLTIVNPPLAKDFTLTLDDYQKVDGGIFLANPNAPTGICLTPAEVEKIVASNPDQLVVIDEAYVDFAPGNSVIPLIHRYDNLLVVQTFSKSRALAGMRLGFGFGNPALIDGLERIKYSFNPYNIDPISSDVGVAALEDPDYFQARVKDIITTRDSTMQSLETLGFSVLPSRTNFVFTTHPKAPAKELYNYLRDNGVLVRYFPTPPIEEYLRITIGTSEEMERCLEVLAQFLLA